jgi:hypothetical protein
MVSIAKRRVDMLLCSSGSLKVAARPGDRHGLIHDPFADAKVSIDPASKFLILASDSVCLETVVVHVRYVGGVAWMVKLTSNR